MIFGQDRQELRQMYLDSWQKSQRGEVLAPLEAQIAAVIQEHPEYQQIVAGTEAPDVPSGQTNPYLHMGLHLALRDQLATNRPYGIREAFDRLKGRCASQHEAEHRFIDCLAETLWEAQNQGVEPDEKKYLERVLRLSS